MADITPSVPAGRQVIQAYGEGGFRIAGVRHQGSVLVLPEETRSLAAAEAKEITHEALAPIFGTAAEVEILLIGCGGAIAPVDSALRSALRASGIAVEPMDTGAACRTFNVLLAEGRAAAAALIAVD